MSDMQFSKTVKSCKLLQFFYQCIAGWTQIMLPNHEHPIIQYHQFDKGLTDPCPYGVSVAVSRVHVTFWNSYSSWSVMQENLWVTQWTDEKAAHKLLTVTDVLWKISPSFSAPSHPVTTSVTHPSHPGRELWEVIPACLTHFPRPASESGCECVCADALRWPRSARLKPELVANSIPPLSHGCTSYRVPVWSNVMLVMEMNFGLKLN